jgi:DNA-binding response OmpR family regulator
MQAQESATSPVTNGPVEATHHPSQQARPGPGGAHRTAEQAMSVQLQRILLVEDDLSLASLEAEVLTAHGYRVTIAQSGELAVAALAQSLPDLVVLDVQLQGQVSGWKVLQGLREQALIPVLLTSSEPTVRAHLRSSGETRSTLDHLPKPYPMHALLKRIERMLASAPGNLGASEEGGPYGPQR